MTMDDFPDDDFGAYDEFEEEQRHDALYTKLTDFTPFLQDMLMEWLGMYYDKNQNKYLPDPNVSPIMNIKGARWCITHLRTYTRDNNIMTRLGDKTYKYMILDEYETVLCNLGARAEEFNLKHDGDILAVARQVRDATALVLAGTYGNRTYSDTISGSYKFTDQGSRAYNPQLPQQPKQGVVAGFKRLFGGTG